MPLGIESGASLLISVKAYGDVDLISDALFDCSGILFAIEQRFPGLDMFGFMEVAIGDEGEFFESDGSEQVVAVGNFPGIEEGFEPFAVVPEIECILSPFASHDVWMGGDGESVLMVDMVDGLFEGEFWRDWVLDVDAEQMS